MSEKIGSRRLEFGSVTSTMDIAREQAERGAPHGTLITAAHQLAGRGRRGANWQDAPGASALMTFVLRPDISLSEVWRLPFIAALAGVRYLREIGIEMSQVKWPNDLVVNGGKLGGLLVEMVSGGEGTQAAFLLGVGINVIQNEFEGSDNFAMKPTSLEQSLEGRTIPTARQVIDGYAQHLDQAFNEYLSTNSALIPAWRTYQMSGQTQFGLAIHSGQLIGGIYRDVRDTDGAAEIEMADGSMIACMPTAG